MTLAAGRAAGGGPGAPWASLTAALPRPFPEMPGGHPISSALGNGAVGMLTKACPGPRHQPSPPIAELEGPPGDELVGKCQVGHNPPRGVVILMDEESSPSAEECRRQPKWRFAPLRWVRR